MDSDSETPSDQKMDVPFKMALPMVAVGTFILALSFAFCCYLARLRKNRTKVSGFKKVRLNKKKENPLQDTKNETCPVCLDDFKNKEVVAICPCSHVFHKKCLCKWLELRPTCPMCMSLISHFPPGNHRAPGNHRNYRPGTSRGYAPSPAVGTPPGLFPAHV